jgi:hypothetical protein
MVRYSSKKLLKSKDFIVQIEINQNVNVSKEAIMLNLFLARVYSLLPSLGSEMETLLLLPWKALQTTVLVTQMCLHLRDSD